MLQLDIFLYLSSFSSNSSTSLIIVSFEKYKTKKDERLRNSGNLINFKIGNHKYDINPKTSEIPQLLELWNRIVLAYECNSLKDIKELELLVAEALESLGIGKIEIEIPDIYEKIAEVEAKKKFAEGRMANAVKSQEDLKNKIKEE